MKNVQILRFFSYESGIRKKEDVKGEIYYVGKFLDDENNKMVSFLIEDVNLADKVAKLEKYKEYTCEIDFERNRYGQYEIKLIDVG